MGPITEGEVAVSYKDYRDHDRWKTMQLPGEELIRRFLLHVLPKGLMRVRHYGFLANRCRKEKLAEIRGILGQRSEEVTVGESVAETKPDWFCPKCHRGQLRMRMEISPVRLSGG